MTNSEKLLKVLGGDPNIYATNYGVRKAILSALGGNPESCSNINEVDLEILRIYESGGGGSISLETANITKNGTYVPSEGYNGFDKAIVNVVPVLETANITKNGTYVASTGYDGFGSVVVNVPADGGGVIKVLDGMKFGYSSTLPENIDTSEVTNFASMFSYCAKISTIPQLNTSNGTNFSAMFSSCTALTSVPQIDTSNGTNFAGMFGTCSNITTIPQLDFSKGTDFNRMFVNCSNITTIPQLDFSKGTDFGYMFVNCSKLTTVSLLDVSKCTSISKLDNMFSNCSNLKNITFVGSINTNIKFGSSSSLTYDSVKSILTACSNTTNTTSKTLTLNVTHTDVDGELAALVADCNTKGWTISGLTLN